MNEIKRDIDATSSESVQGIWNLVQLCTIKVIHLVK